MSEEIGTASELVVIGNLNPVTVFAVEGGSQSVIDSIRSQVANLKLDISTEKGRKEIKSVAYKIATTKTDLDNAGKILKADIQKQVDLVDKERKSIRDALDDLKEQVRQPLTDFENAEKMRVQVREDRIAQIKNISSTLLDADVATIQAHLNQLTEFEVFDWQEFSMRAKSTADESRLILEGMKSLRIKYDADQAELAELRRQQEEQAQKERDVQIAKDAAEAATKAAAEKAAEDARIAKEAADKEIADAAAAEDAARVAKEKAEQDAKDATARAEKAEADRIAADAKAKADAAAAKIKADDDAKAAADAATKAERERAAAAKKADNDAAKAREADKNHRGKINRLALDAIKEIISAFKETGNDPSQAIVEAIVRGKIPNVNIKY